MPFHRKLALLSATILLTLSGVSRPGPVFADTVDPNTPRVTASAYGGCYARAIPRDDFLQIGTTEIYQVTAGPRDRLLFSFDWYSGSIYLQCGAPGSESADLSLVRMGNWPDGEEASDQDLAIEFFHGGKSVARYTTLDIAGSKDNVRRSASHYEVIAKIDGYSYAERFGITTTDGRALEFDIKTGQPFVCKPELNC